MSDDIKYARPFKRSMASNIDLMITSVIRLIIFKILTFFTIKEEIKLLQKDLQYAINNGIITQDNSDSFMSFISTNQYSIEIMEYLPTILFLVFIIGALYYPIMESSNKCATFGKKLMKIMIIDCDGKKQTFLQSSIRYIINLVPIMLIFYIFSRISSGSVDGLLILISLIPFFWFNISSFNKEKQTLTDILSNSLSIDVKNK
jgi:uncharacterized RDD family membrane protein YckC